MPFRNKRQSFILCLLIAVALPLYATAGMLDPEDSFSPNTVSPSSQSNLKEKLDEARKNAGSPELPANRPVVTPAVQADIAPAKVAPVISKPGPAPVQPVTTIVQSKDPVIHKHVEHRGTLDDTINSQPVAASKPFPAVAQPKAVAAAPVSQQLVKFDGNIAAPPASDLHSLLFDDAVEKPAATMRSGAAVEAMQAVPVIPVQNELMPAPVPFHSTPAKQAERVITHAAPAMPAPAVMPLPQISDTAPVARKASPMVSTAPAIAFVPAVEIRKAPVTPAPSPITNSHFKPMPSKPMGEWATRNMDRSESSKQNDALCLLQNRFDNHLALVIGQSAGGDGLIGIDYGVDMLNSGQAYTPKVEIDDKFSQEIPAYANGSNKLMIQLGKNPEFFAALQSGESLHISMRGAASTFSLNGMNQGLQNFSKCVASIGGPALPAALAKTITQEQQPMPAVPVPQIVQENIISSPPPIISAPVPSERFSDAPSQNTNWSGNITETMKQAGLIPYQLQKMDNQIQWSNANSRLATTVQLVPVADILDASSMILDRSEKNCGGQFASQMGIPERRGHSDVLQMESKCVRNGTNLVSTWTIVKDALGVTAWQMEAPRDERGLAFDARQQLLNALAR